MIGYYEAVNGVFLEPVGTGVPVAGSYDTSHLNRLEVVGTPEVLTVSANGTAQTASVVNLFSTGTVYDEQDIISGVVTRKTEVVVSGGVITVQALAEPVTEQVAAQHPHTSAGDNTVSVTAAVEGVEIAAEYAKQSA